MDMDFNADETERLPGTFKYKGVVYMSIINKAILKSPEIVKCRDDDVFVVSYPKSGTTWAIEIVSLLMNGGDVEANRAKMQSARNPTVELHVSWFFQMLMYIFTILASFIPRWHFIEKHIPILTVDKVRSMNGIRQIERIPSPRVIKSHLQYLFFPTQALNKKCKIVYVARNPKDAAVSFYYMHRMIPFIGSYIRSWDHFYKRFINKQVIVGDWFDHVLGWWKHKDEENVLFIKYEDMKKDIRGTIKKIAVFLDVDLTEELMETIVDYTSFKKMKENKQVNVVEKKVENEKIAFVRKGIIGDWVNHFTVAQNSHFDKIYEERMAGSGLDFEFYPSD